MLFVSSKNIVIARHIVIARPLKGIKGKMVSSKNIVIARHIVISRFVIARLYCIFENFILKKGRLLSMVRSWISWSEMY